VKQEGRERREGKIGKSSHAVMDFLSEGHDRIGHGAAEK
jgi:hypothetical protein